ncbi:MAG: ABC transporter ATP-binding protein [Candidatus Entotheonella factor]|uniref:ABC transporter ATP-binding protein n=1 Tax=Entotheonella factor TaxID=1429438 RepID=W4LH67_ENTF1|nr:ABC transporter ATP-binding protein [Candidatus Entotheonella palauensis]ETW97302.1 MAG: ABC transporter ATP-binding protein [Candidatus Entotheonella factor]
MALLEVRGVVRVFGELRALDGVDFDVEAGQFHGLVGPNGSGKSTLMQCIAGALSPTQGHVTFDGQNVTGQRPDERAHAGLSIKFQITSVLPVLSVYDNVLLAMQSRSRTLDLLRSRSRNALHTRVLSALEQFKLSDRSDALASELSHGEQQWLEIAMSLACEPRLLLLDEPTAGMSLEERKVTGELLEPLRGSCALVVVEHDLDFIRDLCDRLTVLDQGQVVGTGTVAEIQQNPRVQEVFLTRV